MTISWEEWMEDRIAPTISPQPVKQVVNVLGPLKRIFDHNYSKGVNKKSDREFLHCFTSSHFLFPNINPCNYGLTLSKQQGMNLVGFEKFPGLVVANELVNPQ